MKKLIFAFFAVTGLLVFNSCSNDSSSASARSYPFKVRMTDAPAAYDEVNIDLQAVEVTGGDGETVVLNTTAGVYNLLDFSNGINTIIATSVLTDSRVNQIRLILGPNNSITVDGVNYPLSTPSAEQSGLKLLVNQTLTADIENEILLDFDAYQSVIETGNGTYKLKPVIRTITTAVSGNISGTVSVLGIAASVTATSMAGVEYSSGVNDMGEFKITGLPAGSYTLTITPELPYAPVIQTDVVVQAGATTEVGTILLL
ncbi:DUF4382 domain-containing protein [Flavobacterium capsici]|uniref:DUF4382 domain-containing protein n=1 Tax=Flavobacterium capsici TaxID=3075618 RepID=A0AA96EVS4_9FLAO|nr:MULTISPECIES: DUF4382 domain-containing protein [unclassified Flavobacterium]WNM18023.1 DUF4382 domain-containing protein [Flavobacterium sp. PMR2A8]WNM22075.1 DUF4382 domain-containing protein [Flavobacterium sp. PMTSA4]